MSPNFGRLGVVFFFSVPAGSHFVVLDCALIHHAATKPCPLLTKRRGSSSILVQAYSRNCSTNNTSAQIMQKRQYRKLHTQHSGPRSNHRVLSLDVEVEIFLDHYPEGKKKSFNIRNREVLCFVRRASIVSRKEVHPPTDYVYAKR